ncbi:MAG: serine hydrolase domain-containing protein [Marinifilaceae bacterium]
MAVHDGLITDIHDKVIDYVWDGTFAGVHNGKITWEHLLTQSSDWSGELFGMHDWADRPPLNGTIDDWKKREIKEPGTSFEYNDVRVNVLSYSLLQVWRKSLPTILKDRIMDPIGASTTWRWYGYENSWVNIDGQKIQSVSGGGHSGGGVFISARDQARFGLLLLRKGKWNDQQLLSVSWINAMKQPSKANESYGFMWWLNKGKYKLRNIDNEDLYYAAGFGGNYIVIDEKNELVVVTRWLEPSKMNEFMMLIQEALK